MNINKIIFWILGAIIVVWALVLSANLWGDDKGAENANTASDFKIWIVEDDESDFSGIITDFQELYPAYKGKQIKIESFSDRRAYNLALTSAFLDNKWPDIFTISNSETSPFEKQIGGIDPARISPNDFRLRFMPIFGTDLILQSESDGNIEFLKWVPAGFESLAIYYNRKYFLKPSEMWTWGDLSLQINSIADKYNGSIVPIALWNARSVSRSSEIVSDFLTLEGNTWIIDVESSESRDVIGLYQSFWEREGDNRYNIFSANTDSSDIELFSEWKVAAVIGYPRDLLKIDDSGYQKTLLFATPFPSYAWKDISRAISYDYFVVNKDTPNPDFGQDFLTYLSTVQGQQKFLESYPYYLSPEASIYVENLEKKILPSYNIVYKNFIQDWSNLVSFDLWDEALYADNTNRILDIEWGADEAFFDLRNFLVCASTKHQTLQNLSSPCK